MTKRERAQVVELLRCAADSEPLCPETWVGSFGAACRLGYVKHGIGDRTYRLAISVRDCVRWPGADFRALNLEAALRVEQGEWP